MSRRVWLFALLACSLFAGCDTSEPPAVVTNLDIRRTTVTQDVVEALVSEGRIPLHERAGARLSALYEDVALTRYCVRYREAGGREGETCGLRRERVNGPSFFDGCFAPAVVGAALPAGCRRASEGATGGAEPVAGNGVPGEASAHPRVANETPRDV